MALMSKRLFSDLDDSVSAILREKYPEKARQLERVQELEDRIDELLLGNMRATYAANAEREIKSKIMRIFLHHTFVEGSSDDRSHFLLSVEGHLLDNEYKYSIPFGSCFEKIRFLPESGKRQQISDRQSEWTESILPDGSKASCFRAKIYGDRLQSVKILLFRRNNIKMRYEISPRLRAIMPDIRIDPTEDEVMLALWQYLIAQNLFVEGRERKVIRCDEIIRDFSGVDSVLLSTLKAKVLEELSPCRPIQIEYNLTLSDTNLVDKFNAAGMGKCGGKACDVEVDVLENQSCNIIDALNCKSHDIVSSHPKLVQRQLQASFISKLIHSKCKEIQELEDLKQTPSSVSTKRVDVPEVVLRSSDYQKLLMARKKVDSRDQPPKSMYCEEKPNSDSYSSTYTSSKKVARISMIPDVPSAIHTSRGYIDVGNDQIFSSKTELLDSVVPVDFSIKSNWKKEAVEGVIKNRMPQQAV